MERRATAKARLSSRFSLHFFLDGLRLRRFGVEGAGMQLRVFDLRRACS